MVWGERLTMTTKIDWWNMQPRWFKRLRLFLSIVWREGPGPDRVSVRLAWELSCGMYPRAPR